MVSYVMYYFDSNWEEYMEDLDMIQYFNIGETQGFTQLMT